MMKKNSGAQIGRLLCLLFMVGILCMNLKFDTYAAADTGTTGTTEKSTVINQPGTSTTPDELSNLNVANNLTITYDNGNGEIAGSLRILIVLTAISLAPIMLIMLTSFTRIIVVLHFTRSALNTQTSPPNNVLIALALFLTFFIMSPTLTTIYNDAVIPFDSGKITQQEALDIGMAPLREFMYKQTQTKDANMFMDIGGYTWTGKLEDIPSVVLIPSFIISELRTAFIIGFLIYIPFIIIDMVVASTLMSMGMMMLPPTTISMPFKILLFVLADGWNLIIGSLVKTFY